MFHEHAIAPAIQSLDQASVRDRYDKGQKMQPLKAQVATKINTWLAKYDIKEEQVLQRFTALRAGVALKLDQASFERISKDPALSSVEHDRMESIPEHKVESIDRATNRAQTIPCGITNVGGTAQANYGRWIWIVDTGIDQDHPDLHVITDPGMPATFVGGTPEDCNGHGTHVAGTAAAKNNNIGVVGVAADAPVVSVRVFGCTGGSPTSTIIAGLDHVGTYDSNGDVVNLSLSGYYGPGCSTGTSYYSHIEALALGGCRIAMASGNNYSSAANYHPGCISRGRTFTVASMRCDLTYYDNPTTGSNYGAPPVDYIATGVNVYSTYLNGGYATLTGTSMATPHVSGIMQWLNTPPVTTANVTHLGVSYPIARRQ